MHYDSSIEINRIISYYIITITVTITLFELHYFLFKQEFSQTHTHTHTHIHTYTHTQCTPNMYRTKHRITRQQLQTLTIM